jgi:hypothetical protein
MQGAELLDDEEQEDDHWPPGVLEVLQSLPQAHRPQGNEVERLSVSSCHQEQRNWQLTALFTGA